MTLDAGYICIARASFFYNIKKRTGKYFLIFIAYILSSVVMKTEAFSVIAMVCFALALIYDFFYIRNVKFVFYTDRVVVTSGVLNTTYDQVFLSKVIAVRFRQSVWGKIFGFGDIFVDQLGDNDFFCKSIKNPQDIVRKLSPLISRPSSRIF